MVKPLSQLLRLQKIEKVNGKLSGAQDSAKPKNVSWAGY